jgi:hypothetical protein
LALSGCGYATWSNPPFSTGSNPHMPVDGSETMRRAMGEPVEIEPLTTEPGDVWPGPVAPEPTLSDIERQGLQTQPERPVPGSPEFQNQQQGQPPNQPPNLPPPPAKRGSSSPPVANVPRLAPLPPPTPPQATNPTPPARNPAGQVYTTPNGPAVTGGGGPGYQTTTTPGGGSAIIVPNGNGTSTIIHSNGTIETVPTPR